MERAGEAIPRGCRYGECGECLVIGRGVFSSKGGRQFAEIMRCAAGLVDM